MAHTLRDRWQCDRCAATAQDRRAADRLPFQPPRWGSLQVHTPPLDPAATAKGHLCDQCLAELDVWLATPPVRG